MAEMNTSPRMWIIVAIFAFCMFAGAITLLGGMGLSLFGRETIGSKLIKFGAECSIIGFLSILVAAADPFISVLVLYWMLWRILRKSKTNLCPHCGAQITREQKIKLIKFFGFRTLISCPSCNDSIILSKWPWRVMVAGLSLFIVLLFLKLFKVNFGYVRSFIFYAPILLFLIGHFFLKLEDIASKA